MRTEDKIRHYVLLKNQHEKNPSKCSLERVERIMDKYDIKLIKPANSYGAMEYKCGRIAFRTFKGKLVTKGISGLTFYKILGESSEKPFSDWTGMNV